MTAFANNTASIDNLTINCELRSVNHRYCDITLRLPEKFRFLEPSLRTTIANNIKRGKLECNINYKYSSESQNLTINSQAATKLIKTISEIEALMQITQPCSALDILTFPSIQQEQVVDQKKLQQALENLLLQALESMLLTREREGQQISLLLEARCHKIAHQVAIAQQRIPIVLQNIRTKITNKFTELVAEPNFERLEQEIVLMLQKLDVAEELERLKMHIIEVQRILTLNEPVGRRLDFLMQEMNREANTLGSKSADQEMTQISIEMKVLIEQMREQIQNIE